jgi:phage gpG-like protein
VQPIIRLDLSKIKKANKRLSRSAKDLRPVWREGAPVLRADVREALKKREGPEGKHPPHSKATLAKRRQQRKSPAAGKRWKRKLARGMLGKLWAPLTTGISPKTLLIRSRVKWSGAHQEGATVGRGVTLPERTHVYITGPFLDWILPKIEKHMGKAWYGRVL